MKRNRENLRIVGIYYIVQRRDIGVRGDILALLWAFRHIGVF
jgi:hypothetical protein